MTNPGDATSDSLSDDPTSTTRYRYYQQPPKTIFVEWSELVDLVPADVITEGKNFTGVMIGLPAEEIFAGIIPRIRYGRLRELLPEGTLQLPGDKQNEFLYIPASRIARHYQMTTLREALPEEPKPVIHVEKPEEKPAEIKPRLVITLPQPDRSQAPIEASKAEGNPVVFSQPVVSHIEKPEEKRREIEQMRVMTLPQPGEDRKPIEAIKAEEKTVDQEEVPPILSGGIPEIRPPAISHIEKLKEKLHEIKSVAVVVPPEVIEEVSPVIAESALYEEAVEIPEAQPETDVLEPVAVKATEKTPVIAAMPEVEAEKEEAVADPVITLPPRPELPRTPLTLPKLDLPIVAQASPASEALDPQQKRSFFGRLPLFRKKPAVEAAEEAPPVIIKPLHTNLPPRHIPPSVSVLKKATQKLSIEKPSLEAELPAPESGVTLMVPESKESALEIRAKEEIPHQGVLQSLFMTDEALTIERTIELSSTLPGVRSCVLARGAGIIASANVPEGIDVVALSTNAMNMLRQMQESLQKMGIGSIPAVTLHSEKGPVSVLPYEDLCMLIFHKDRAFIPGVRERLQDVMKELSHANLPLALETDIKKAPEVA
ncbi:MAG: hypothetical protein ABI443_04980 [Chthoniobacterales bacterium]